MSSWTSTFANRRFSIPPCLKSFAQSQHRPGASDFGRPVRIGRDSRSGTIPVCLRQLLPEAVRVIFGYLYSVEHGKRQLRLVLLVGRVLFHVQEGPGKLLLADAVVGWSEPQPHAVHRLAGLLLVTFLEVPDHVDARPDDLSVQEALPRE